MSLDKLKPAPGSRRSPKRVGRGPGSGTGRTAGRGDNGQKSRSGYSRKAGFEGGQMPLYRRVPKRGFHNKFAKQIVAINLGRLDLLEAGTIVTPELLRERRMIRPVRDGLKVLAGGELSKALTVRAHSFSAKAKEKILAAGGKIEIIGAEDSKS